MDEPLYVGFLLIIGLIALITVSTVIEIIFNNGLIDNEINVTSTIISCIYQYILAIYEKCRHIREIDNIGETVSYINIDRQRIENFFLYLIIDLNCIISSVMY